MAYTPTEWKDGDAITAEKLNKIEKGVATEKGPKGDKGDPGVAGPKGDKGDTGATGAKGADGYGTKAEFEALAARVKTLEDAGA